MSRKMLFNTGWLFRKVTEDYETDWERVMLPHDWQIYDTQKLYEDGEGWYKKEFIYQPADELAFLRFDGVYMDCTIWINGEEAFAWKYGYSSFEFEITDYLIEGNNEILVKTVFKGPNSRWYSGAGIYRNVWFVTRSDSHFVADGIYVSTECVDGLQAADNNEWLVKVSSEFVLDSLDVANGLEDVSIRYSIADNDNNCVAASEDNVCLSAYVDACSTEVENKKREHIIKHDSLIFTNNIKKWDIEAPNLYILSVNLYVKNELVDNEIVRFGFRKIEYLPQKGFLLNGRKVVLNGVCMHHDLGCLGAAVNKHAIKRQLEIMKSMGANAIRTAHNMPASELLDLADEMGLLVNDESFDMWELSKTPYDYARFFNDWHEKDVASWIRRDRNHPCVIMWSIGNEIYDTHAGERGRELTRMLMELVRSHDPNQNAAATLGSNYMPWENTQKCADIIKLIGYNYAEAYYDEHHKEHKDWIIYGSETASVVQSRGIYHFPADVPILDDDDRQCSSLGNSITSWGAKSIEKCIIDNQNADYSAGMFIWSGFDYIGEPTPYHTKNSYFGQVDTAGFAKDSFYVYQAEWTDYRNYPMVHVWPYWDFNEGQLIDIMVCSNAPKVELFVNGVSLGVKLIDHKHGNERIARWKHPYSKGELRAVAYDEHDNIIAQDCTESFGDPVKLEAVCDKYTFNSDGTDLVFVTIYALDADGHEVCNANNRINVTVTGSGRLAGLDNGDSTDTDSYKCNSRRMFSGKLLAVIQSDNTEGNVVVTIESKGLEPVTIHLVANDTCCCNKENKLSENNSEFYVDDVTICEIYEEVPIRKLEIVAKDRVFTKDRPVIEAIVNILPANATYDDICWRATDDRGVTSGIVNLEVTDNRVVMHGVADGTFRLRCTANNAKKHPDIISVLEFTVEGMGVMHYNPYELISGSLYSYSEGAVAGGNERGVATPRDHKSILVYDNIDFGEWGSDLITIPIFELESSELNFEIWEGIPFADGSTLLLDAVYDKPSIWNTYQEETFKLAKRVKGISSIGFVFYRKAHVKGFKFERLDKAYCRINMSDADSVYGDSYSIKGEVAYDIGNNVSFVYENMDFGSKGAGKITICGRTSLDNNTIHVRFENEEQSYNNIIEFEKSEEFTERSFELEMLQGCGSVSFIFLPGSNFDFAWFRFDS